MNKLIKLKEIEHLILLSRLEFSESEKKKMLKDLNEILNFVSELKKIGAEKEKPFLYEDQVNIFRENEKPKDKNPGTYLRQAPQRERQFFKVPRILN